MDNLSPIDLESYTDGDPQTAINAALATVRAHCRWHIAPSVGEVQEVLSASPQHLMLPTMRMTQLVRIETVAGSEIPLDSVSWTKSGIITARRGAGRFGYGEPFIVTYNHGYDTLPEDVRRVVLGIAYRQIDNPAQRQRTQEQDLADVYAAAGLTAADTGILSAYRIPSLP